MSSLRTIDEWKSVLRAALRDALRAKQPHAVTVIRETLAALDNAEAVAPGATPAAGDTPIAGAVAGLGAGEVPRRALGADEVSAILERELRERRDAAASYAALGRHDEARSLQQQIEVLETLRG